MSSTKPEPPLVGAFDPSAWSGVVLCDGPGRGFAFRVAVERDGAYADGGDLFFLVADAGPCAPDGSYARVAFDLSLPFGREAETPIRDRSEEREGLVLEWSRTPEGAAARAEARFAGFVDVRAYFPWDWTGSWTEAEGAITGRSHDRASRCRLAVSPRPAHVWRDGEELVARVPVAPGTILTIQILVGPADGIGATARGAEGVAALLRERAARYADTRVRSTGHWAGLVESVTDNLHWTVALQPEHGRRYTPAGRRWVFPRAEGGRDHWTIFCWDAFLNGVELALESPDLARETFEAVLETQYPAGNVPNWRGRFGGTPDRSQPPIGSFAILKYALRTGDRDLLGYAFPYLERWSDWWRAPKGPHRRRDGNGDGLFEWGADLAEVSPWAPPWERGVEPRQLAAWESGQDDLPNWDEARWVGAAETMDLGAVDLNAYLALDAECLARTADILGLPERAAVHRARHEALAERMNALLWDEERGVYADRLWDGRRSPRLAASNFLPLLAGIPTPEQAQRMLEVLEDPTKFWGDHLLPTVSRDDPAFPEQQYWRGTIWPPMNYLVCQGLRRYRLDATAAHLAGRSADLFLASWRRWGLCRENFDSRTGEGGGQRFQSWGPLFALLGVEEFLDVTPWEGLRLGSLGPPPPSTVERVPIGEHRWDVRLAPDRFEATRNGLRVVSADGPVVLRDVTITGVELTATVTAAHPVHLTPWPGSAAAGVRVNDVSVPGRVASLPAGSARLAAVRVEGA